MSKTLKDCIGKKDLYETNFVNADGEVYHVEDVLFQPTELSFSERLFGVRKVDYGVANCRLIAGIRYTIHLSDHLSDLANPSEEVVNASRERGMAEIRELGANSQHLTL